MIDRRYEIYIEYNHIALDCSCSYGSRLAAYCIEIRKEFYVNSFHNNC